MSIPDIRPITVLTREILDSSPAWMFLHSVDVTRSASVHPSDELRMGPPATPEDPLPSVLVSHLRYKSYYREHNATCYPCEPLPPFTPLPWPVLVGVLHGEVEIEEWREIAFVGAAHKDIWAPYWYPIGIDDPAGHLRIIARVGFHPALKRNVDGLSVWVWEADK